MRLLQEGHQMQKTTSTHLFHRSQPRLMDRLDGVGVRICLRRQRRPEGRGLGPLAMSANNEGPTSAPVINCRDGAALGRSQG